MGVEPERRASFARRVAALLIDWGACLVIATVLFSSAVPWTPDYSFGSPDLSLIVLGLFVLETSVLVWLIQGSFGQRLVGISVVSVSGRMNYWRSLARALLVSLVIPPLVMDEDGRGLQDRATQTQVWNGDTRIRANLGLQNGDRDLEMRKQKVVLCDLNMGSRPRITANITVACRIAHDLDAQVMGFCAVSSFKSVKLSEEFSDLRVIASFFGIHAGYLQPRVGLVLRHLVNNWSAAKLFFWCLISPNRLASSRFEGFPLGQWAADSQRRRTLSLGVSTFPLFRSPPSDASYPWLPANSFWPINLIALSLPRFVGRALINFTFWRKYLSDTHVVASVQSHAERSEFGPLTSLLIANKVRLIMNLERIEVMDANLELTVKSGLAWLNSLSSSEKEASFKLAGDSLKSSFFGAPLRVRNYTQTFIGSDSSNKVLTSLVDGLLETQKAVLVVALPATFEAFNHYRDSQVFHSYTEWFRSIDRVQRETKIPLVIKPHPHGDVGEIVRIENFLRSVRLRSSSWSIAPRDCSLLALSGSEGNIVFTALSSSVIIEVAYLGFPVVVADVSDFMWWDFGSAPGSPLDYESKLIEALSKNSSPNFFEVMEALVLTNYHNNSAKALSILRPGPRYEDMNQLLLDGYSQYSQSSTRLVLSSERVEKGFQDAGVWETLANAYAPPKVDKTTGTS